MSYVQSMAKKNLLFKFYQQMSLALHCLVRNVSSDVNVSCFKGESMPATCSGLSTWTHGPDLPRSKSSAESVQGLGSVL